MTEKERARAVYDCVCEYLDGKGYEYESRDDALSVVVQFVGDDFPLTVMVRVEPENSRVLVFGRLPFEVRKEKIVDLVMATTYVNQVLAHGAFCVRGDQGYCSYEACEIYAGLTGFNPEYAERIITSAVGAMEKYDDGLFAVNKGLSSVKEFAATV